MRLEAIRLEQASLRLGRHRALRDVSMELRAGQRWLLAGANGAGKTVLLKLLRGELWPTPTGREQRRYLLDGEWQDQPLHARERIACIGPERQDRYERHGLDATVAATVATGLTGEDLLLDEPDAAQWREVRVALEGVGLAGLAGRRFLSLSYGQRRRVLLARALVGRPDVLLLDEVLNGLDAAARRAFVRALHRAGGARLAWVLATHRSGDRPRGVTHVARLEHGRLSVEPVAADRRAGARAGRAAGAGAAAASSARAPSGVPEATSSQGTPVPEPTLRLERVRVYRDGRLALGPLDWSVAAGEHWWVTGPNGAGKSTLMALLYGDCAAAVGGRVQRRWLAPGSPVEEWKRRVGLVSPELQSTCAATACTAEEIVISGRYSSIGLGAPPTAAERRGARRWLARVGLAGLARRPARELSYGQLRRVLVARALVVPRRLLLLDEPFEGLDAEARRIVVGLLAAAVAGGTQLVLATHHAEDVPPCATRRLRLAGGRVRGRAADAAAAAVTPTGRRSRR
jgi:molybdate transport system ATP-binding protein